MKHFVKRTFAFLIAALTMIPSLMLAHAVAQTPSPEQLQTQLPDTVTVRKLSSEFTLSQEKMASTERPVEVRQLGRHLRVKSRSEQLLPVYTAQGSYYASFRLLKGTNWITGLPRGTYFINHRKYTIN